MWEYRSPWETDNFKDMLRLRTPRSDIITLIRIDVGSKHYTCVIKNKNMLVGCDFG